MQVKPVAAPEEFVITLSHKEAANLVAYGLVGNKSATAGNLRRALVDAGCDSNRAGF